MSARSSSPKVRSDKRQDIGDEWLKCERALEDFVGEKRERHAYHVA
jgi:hypothetical protein